MEKSEKDYLLGYMAHYQTQQRAYYGGILVTDIRGVPKEFRHSEGIRPTRMQTTLYGDSLETSLGTDALAPALYGALTLKPDVLIVDKESRLLFGSFANAHTPAALLVPLPDPDLAFADTLTMDGNLLDARDFDLRGSTSERVYAYIEEGRSGDMGARALQAAQKTMNLMSPFERIRLVLAEVAQAEHGRSR